jgi:shikimate kinase
MRTAVSRLTLPGGRRDHGGVTADANIVLVGFMGTGKTSVGRALATALGRSFVDMDAEIVQRAGKPIPRIFAEDGETHFRALERTVVQSLAARQGLVVATGGGVVLNPANLADFNRSGLVVCLQAAPTTILKRVEHDTNRPLLYTDDKLGKIRDLLAARQPLYDAIPVQIATDALTCDEVVAAVLARFRQAAVERHDA